MKHFTKAMLSVLLVVSLALGMTVPALAAVSSEADKTLKYVSLGDSMTNGYGLTNYDNNGYNTYGEEAYPNQFADWLVAEGYADSVEHTQLAMSAMRAEDLHYILEFPVDNAEAIAVATAKTWDEEAWNAIFPVGDFYTWDEFTDGRFRQNCVNVNEAAKAYQAAVADADIISIGSGNANFGVFLMGRLTNAVGFNGDASEDAWISLDRAIAECDETTREYIYLVKAEIDKLLAQKLAEMNNPQLNALSEPLYNAVSYTAVSFVLNYAGAVERILKLNPDAQIMLVGIMNTMAGMSLTVEQDGVTTEIPMEDVLGMIVEPVNAYIAALPTVMKALGNETYAEADFFYAECPEVECLVDTYATAIRNPQSVVRARFVEEIVGEKGDGLVWSMVSPMLSQYGVTLVPITVQDIQTYEANPYAFITNINKMFSCAVYLGFENAVVEASAGDTLPLASIELIASGDLSTAFAGVGEKLMANPSVLFNPVTLSTALTDALTSDDTLMGLLHLFGRMLIGNGLGAHPSVNGHNDLAAAVIDSYENGYTAKEETMKNLVIAANKGKDFLAGAYNYAVAKGYVEQAEAAVAALEQELAALNAQLVALKAQADAQVAQTIAAVEAKIAAIEAKIAALNAKLAQLVANVNAYADTAVDTIEVTYAQLTALVNEVAALVAQVENELKNLDDLAAVMLDAVKATANETANEIAGQIKATLSAMAQNGVNALKTAVDNFVADVQATVNGQINTVKAVLAQMYLEATTADYTLSNKSYYVALGDGSAESLSYADELVARWEAAYNTELSFTNLASAGQTVLDAYDIVMNNAADIQKADLITVGYGNNSFMHAAAVQVWKGVAGAPTETYDWVGLVGEAAAPFVQYALDRVYDEMVAQGLDTVKIGNVTVATLATLAVESYAFNALTYAKNLPVLVSAIRAINPDAVVAIVGMHNSLDGAVFEMNGATVDVSRYIDKVVEAVDAYGVSLCMLTGDAIYVKAQDVATPVTGQTVNAMQFIGQYIGSEALLDPTADGHAYIAEQLDIAIDETFLMMGDIDNDGDMDMRDAMLLYSVVGGVKEFGPGEGAMADYDMNGVVNMRDVMALYKDISGE